MFQITSPDIFIVAKILLELFSRPLPLSRNLTTDFIKYLQKDYAEKVLSAGPFASVIFLRIAIAFIIPPCECLEVKTSITIFQN